MKATRTHRPRCLSPGAEGPPVTPVVDPAEGAAERSQAPTGAPGKLPSTKQKKPPGEDRHLPCALCPQPATQSCSVVMVTRSRMLVAARIFKTKTSGRPLRQGCRTQQRKIQGARVTCISDGQGATVQGTSAPQAAGWYLLSIWRSDLTGGPAVPLPVSEIVGAVV